MKHLLLLTALASPFVLSGCVISVSDDGIDGYHGMDWQDREHNNRNHIAKLELGASYEQVTRKMGIADFNELVNGDNGPVRILYYRTQRTRDDGVTTKDECTPIVFVDGVLTGWGDAALDAI